MSLFGNLTNDGLEESTDRLGGFAVHETDIYEATVKLAYAGKAASGAQFVGLVFDIGGGKEYKEQIYITNKKGENYFINKDDKTKKVPLPGFTLIDDLHLLITERPLSEATSEEKVVNLYDAQLKKEAPSKVDALTELHGQKIGLGLLKKLENKQVKNEATGEYEPTDETREANSIDKFYHLATKLTVAEARAGKTAGEFWDSWVERNKGKTRDARKNKGTGAIPGRPQKPGTPPTATSSATPARASLFGKK